MFSISEHKETKYPLKLFNVFSAEPVSLVFFRIAGISLSQKDLKGGTPLHWAAFYGCEYAVSFLLSFKHIVIDCLDNEGFTPLHLAAMSGNAKIVKRLLIKGCDKSLRNKKGQTAQDLAQENDNKNIVNLLSSQKNWLTSYLNIKVDVLQLKKSKTHMARFLMMYFFVVGTQIFCDFFYNLEFEVFKSGFDTYCLLQVITMILFVLLCNSNPGHLKLELQKQNDDQQQSLLQLLRQFENIEICPDCVAYKAPRSKHCDICDVCIKVYDHHCPWIDRCVFQ